MMMEGVTVPGERHSRRSPDHLGLHLLDAVGRPKNMSSSLRSSKGTGQQHSLGLRSYFAIALV